MAARVAGADDSEIGEAIDIGEMVKETAIMNSRITIDLLLSELSVKKVEKGDNPPITEDTG
ncbi:MAG: hypothetical protein ACYDEQ_02010 [Desulfocucumaceae bacterium]